MSAAAFVLAASLAQAGEHAPTACPAELIRIARSKNANVVVYEANRTASGGLDPDDPVRASWIMLAEQGQREGLNFFEKLFAYGFDVRSAAPDRGYVVRLHAKKDQVIRVVEHQGCPAAMSDIGGHPGILKRIYVQADDGQLIPEVLYVELFGIDPVTGAALYQKIVPDPAQQAASLAAIREGRRGGVAGTR